ncbi:hypothetical protein C4552_01200 [Candidatus Parcubacteria bacterium]|nr:MAG: hypothetical protein C4552_01200 [Candidatus Parcubacteria bacterium]
MPTQPKTNPAGVILGVTIIAATLSLGAVFVLGMVMGSVTDTPHNAATVATNHVPPPPASLSRSQLPSAVSHTVPFTAQAPLGNWVQPYQDACEETSVIMAIAWASGIETLAPQSVSDEIDRIVAFENYEFGYNRDTAIRETAKILTRFYGYPHVSMRYDIGVTDIKRELASGRIVIAAASGLVLRHPGYAKPPPYHMIVITGYDDARQEFIAHDPGTRFGGNSRYAYDVLDEALHDWTGDYDTVLTEGRRAIIVVSRPE